jgi:hypothetical protein
VPQVGDQTFNTWTFWEKSSYSNLTERGFLQSEKQHQQNQAGHQHIFNSELLYEFSLKLRARQDVFSMRSCSAIY